MKRGKYLFISSNDGSQWGGSEILWSSAAARLVAGGNDVRVSVKGWDEPTPQVERLRSAGCQVFYRRPPTRLSRLIGKVLPLSDRARTHMQVVARDVDLVVISQGSNVDGLEWMEAARSLGVKYSAIAHGAAECWWPEDAFADKLCENYENASASYFVSQANLELSRRQFGAALTNAKIIRNPFNVRYDACPRWPDELSDGLSLACVASLDVEHKGQDLLLEVLSLAHWRARKLRVSLVGRGKHERGLRRIVEAKKLSSVHFVGFMDDIEKVWSEHHGMVLASRYEGMPLALVEAMLCGRPCIVTDVAGHAELVRDGVNGFLAKATTVELVDEAMNRAWQERAQLRDMGRKAAEDVRGWVSKDPTGDFVRELRTLVDEGVRMK